MKITRSQIRQIIIKETLTIAENEDRVSEMREFAETRGGKNVMAAGSKIMNAGNTIREAAMHQTGAMKKTVETVANFVETLGGALQSINSLNEDESASSRLPTVNEFKQMVKAIERIDR